MFVFDHDGITTTVPQPGENWVEQSGVWVTNPHEHPEHIELLRDEGGALHEEFGYFADCALRGNTPTIGRPEDAAAALEATLAAKELARTRSVVKIGV